MIIDTLSHLDRYLGLHPNLDIAITYLQSHDVAALPIGRTEVAGDNVFINVMDAELRPAGDAEFEYHRRYADLQLDLSGSEECGWTVLDDSDDGFDAAGDIGFAHGEEQGSAVLGDGRFVIFLPGELHKPCCLRGDCAAVRKAVVKIDMT
ncbi:MAG: YhcH/YjgK/YiaL family protein [Acutalibacteraceae bacterium]